MKKRIDGRIYDTETAKKIGRFYTNRPQSDFGYYDETLYLKRTGEYFLYGEGNAASPYSKSCEDGSWGAGSDIIPMTEKEAREWAEKKLDTDEFEFPWD